MREVREDISRWMSEGSKVALVQVIKTWGSSPRSPGSVMAVSSSGQISGSVSGGCIEGAVIQSALECLDGEGARIEQFHASTLRARELGLSCGGNVDVFISSLDQGLFEAEKRLQEADCEYMRVSVTQAPDASNVGCSFLIAAKEPAGDDAAETSSRSTVEAPLQLHPHVPAPFQVFTGDSSPYAAGSAASFEALAEKLWSLPRAHTAGMLEDGDTAYFFSREMPKPQLICIGGVHIAIHLTQIAKALGYRTVVIDPRKVFSTEERFPSVDELVHAWPQEAFKGIRLNASSAVCALTHDPKIDVPALAIALNSSAFYLGSLGRYTTQLSRYTHLHGMGYSDEAISRIYGPIGLDLKAKNPGEIALSVMAEITAVRNGSPCEAATMVSSAQKARGEQHAVRATA